MLDKDFMTLLGELSENSYVTSDWLARQLQIGMRTVRKRLKELDDMLKNRGASVDSKPRYGYRLVVWDRELLNEFLEHHRLPEPEGEKVPSTNEERFSYLLFYLLNQNGYVKSEDLMEFLCVSKGTLSGALKQVERAAGQYRLNLERRPNYGIRITGEEFDIRRCMGEWFVHKGIFRELGEERQNSELSRLARVTLECAGAYEIRFSETLFERFINDIYIQMRRIRNGCLVDIPVEDLRGLSRGEWDFVGEMADRLSELYDMKLPGEEQMYIALHLAGKRMVGCEAQNELNFVIHEDIDRLVMGMLDVVYSQTKMDLRGNFDIRMSLNQHLVPMDIRIRYDIPLTNPMLDNIKENYIMGYSVAAQAVSVLKEYYQKDISEDEIGYLALIFALTLEQYEEEKETEKSSILIVCNSGKGISRLLVYRFKQTFGEYLKQIYVSSLFDLESFDFARVDYVFTTVPIRMSVPVPIQEVGLFLEQKDILKVRRVLESGNRGFLLNYYQREHFLTDIKGNTREEILRNLCSRIYEMHDHPPGLYESVMKRELVCSTDFGNLVAIPHPYQVMTQETYVYVAILEEAVIWNHYPVQAVFLTMIGQKEDKDLQGFYEATTSLIADKQAISLLVEQRDYDTLLQLLLLVNT